MNTIIKRALWGTLLAGGITLLGATAATAAETTGEDALLSGTQGLVDIALPISITGTSISLVGDSTSEAPPAAVPAPEAPMDAAATTSGSDAVASGTQGIVSVAVPVSIGGNAVSVVGDSSSASAAPAAPTAPEAAPAAPAVTSTTGADGILSGSQAGVPVDLPVSVAGNAISVLGDSRSGSAPATAAATTTEQDAPPSGTGTSTTGDDGLLGGTQVLAPVSAPVTATGNAVSVLGDSRSASSAAAGTTPTATGPGGTTTGGDSLIGGTQVMAPIALPITVGGNAVSVIGDTATSEPAPPIAQPVTPATPSIPGSPATPEASADGGAAGTSGVGANAFATGAGAAVLAATGGAGILPLLFAALALCAVGAVTVMSRRSAA